MYKVSPKIKSQKCRWIFGETRYIIKDKETGSEIINESYSILVGEIYSDYEVYGTYVTYFIALYMSPW